MRENNDKAGAAIILDANLSSTIGAGAAGVMPFTAATGRTAFAVSSAFGIYEVSVGNSTNL